jgi:hypothetical protein
MNSYQKKATQCKCVGKHVPLPTTLKEYNGVMLCATTYDNVLEYKKMWEVLGCEPPGNIRKHFSEYVQKIVKESLDRTKVLL